MLALPDVHTYYGKSHVLHGVSIEVGPGEVVGLLGRNGVGKSTTLKTIMGIVRPAQGRVVFENHDVGGMPPYRVARIGIGYVPEDRRIFRLLTDRKSTPELQSHSDLVCRLLLEKKNTQQ